MTTPDGFYLDYKGNKKIVYKLGHKPEAIYKAWSSAQADPNLITCFHDKVGLTFLLSYEVRLDEWRYVVQSHVHFRKGKLVGGGTWLSGAGPDHAENTPDWVVGQAPKPAMKEAYTNGWSSDTTYQAKLYKDDYHRPTNLFK